MQEGLAVSLMQRPEQRCLILLVVPVLLFLVCFLVFSNFSPRFCNSLILLILGFVPVNVVLTRDLLDVFPVSIRLFNESIPLLDIEALLLIQLRLSATNGEVER